MPGQPTDEYLAGQESTKGLSHEEYRERMYGEENMTDTTPTNDELIEWCRDFVFFNGALDQSNISHHKITVNAIATRLIAAQKMAEALRITIDSVAICNQEETSAIHLCCVSLSEWEKQ